MTARLFRPSGRLDAVSVADVIGACIEVVNFRRRIQGTGFFGVFMRDEAGNNWQCNAEIKFKAFLDHAVSLGAEQIATGHYARVRENNGLFELMKAVDDTKDQSYFLHRLNQKQLSKAIFPFRRNPENGSRENC